MSMTFSIGDICHTQTCFFFVGQFAVWRLSYVSSLSEQAMCRIARFNHVYSDCSFHVPTLVSQNVFDLSPVPFCIC